ncbi:hypothetical protein ACIQMJ_12770 [Actinosynnema sp. NPDC091369]
MTGWITRADLDHYFTEAGREAYFITWTLTFDHANAGAAAMWRQVVASVADGAVTEVDETEPVPSTPLRFRVA